MKKTAKKVQDKRVQEARKKFILGATVAATIAVLMLVLSINTVRFVQVTNQQREVLLSLSESEHKDKTNAQNHIQDIPSEEKVIDTRGKMGRKSPDTQYSWHFAEITVFSDGTVDLHAKNEEVLTQSEAEELTETILSKGKTEGYLEDFRYLMSEQPDGTTVISLLDCTTDASDLSDLRNITIAIGLLGVLAAFGVILVTSQKAMIPLVESIEKQKRFVTDASHELKTPLSVIATNMDILTMDYGENEWIDGTKKQVTSLRKLINQLVSLSKLDEQDTVFSLTPFSVSDAAIECTELYSSVADSAGKRIEADIEDGITVTADETSVNQLFSILLDNAVKYAEGDRVIHVRLYREGKRAVFETENDWVRNVDPAKIETLFDRFTRGDRSRSGADGKNGFGLGLAIARSAAEKNHATLNASVTAEGKLRFTLKI